MSKFTKLGLLFLNVRAWRSYATRIKAFTAVYLFITLLLSGTTSAQETFPACTKGNGQPTLPHCVSQDLAVLNAYLTGVCFCEAGGLATGTLNFTLSNKTGSTRGAFAFFANLVQTNSDGDVLSTTYLTDCQVPVLPGSVSTITFNEEVEFLCGSTLTLTNVYIAWTDAGTNSTCPLAFCGIAPKCGRPGDITINPLLTATTTSSPACTGQSDGSLTVNPSGGVSPYDITIGSTTFTDVSSATFTGLSAGIHEVSVTDAANTACNYTFDATVGAQDCCVAPAKPIVCETKAGFCGDGTASVTISNAVEGDTYYLTQGSNTSSQVGPANGIITFAGLTPGVDFSVYGENVVGTTTCRGDAATCDDLTGTCEPIAALAKSPSNIESIVARIDSKTKVIAAPNPFNDKIRFSLQSEVSGQGSLELYNMMGQRVKTVFQGYVEAGRARNIEYSVPGSQRSNLIYVFTVGEQKTSGKLIGLK